MISVEYRVEYGASWLRNLQLTTSLDNKLNWCSFRYLTALL